MQPSFTCLGPDELKKFIAGDMAPKRVDEIEDHLSTCETCRGSLEATVGDQSWWQDLESALRSDTANGEYENTESKESVCQRLTALLGPTDDPSMLGRIGAYVRRQLRETAEMSCDALAIAAHPESRREYAELLLRLSSQSTNDVPVPVIAMGAGNVASFEKRLKMILSSNVSGSLSWRGAVAIALLAVIALPYWSLAQSTNLEPSPTLAQQSDTAKESRKATEPDHDDDSIVVGEKPDTSANKMPSSTHQFIAAKPNHVNFVSSGTVYQCESGKNTHIEIGVGRTVTGKLQLPEHIQKSKLQVVARNHLLPIPYPKDWTDQVTQAERDAWEIKWLQTAEGYEYADRNYVLVNTSVPGSIADDGTFTMYGVSERPMVLVVLLPGEGILLEQPFDTSDAPNINAPSNALNLGTVTVSDTRLPDELDRSQPIRRDVRLKPMPDVELKVLLPDGNPAEKAQLKFHYPNGLECLQVFEWESSSQGIVTTKFPPHADIGSFRLEHPDGTAELPMQELLDEVKQSPGKVIRRNIQLRKSK